MLGIWQILSPVSAVLAGACVFALSKDVKKFHKYMGFTLLFEGLWMIMSASVKYEMDVFSPALYLLSVAMMLTAPFFYFVSCRYLLREEGVRKTDFWMLEAVAVFLTAALVAIRCTGEVDRFLFLSTLRGAEISPLPSGVRLLLSMDNLALILFLAEAVFAAGFCIVGVRKYSQMLESFYSSTKGKSTIQIHLLLAIVLCKLGIAALLIFFPSLSATAWMPVTKCILDIFFYAAAAYLTIRTEFTSEELAKSVTVSEIKVKQTPAASEAISEYLGKLIAEDFFLNPEVDLFMLSEKIQINSKYIANYIRYTYKESFMVFVNRLRVERSIEMMKDKELSLQAISDDCGFITPSTYYRNFIKVKGVSPSEYRKTI